jgi:predicted dehydrogenase
MRGVEVAGLADPSPENVARVRERVGALARVPAFDSSAGLYDSLDLDAVVVTTPHTLHHALVMEAIERGLHVLCEKPLACTPPHAQEIEAAAAAAGVTVTIGYQRRFDPGYVYMHDVIERGELGELLAVSVTCGQRWEPRTRSGWRQVPELSGGGMLMDTGSHIIDVLLWLVDRQVTTVSALVDNRGTRVDIDTVATLGFEGGIQGQLMILGDMPFTWMESIIVTGTDGALRYENEPQHPWRPGHVSHYRDGAETRPLDLRGWGPDVTSAWVATIRGERDNPVPPAAGVRVAELTWMILEAGRTSRSHSLLPD